MALRHRDDPDDETRQDRDHNHSEASPRRSAPQTGNGRGATEHREVALSRSGPSLSPVGIRPNHIDLGDISAWDPHEWDLADLRWEGWFRNDPSAWPAWVQGFREHQLHAIVEIVDAYNRGADVVMLDAPTGAGKTLIGEAVRRLVTDKSIYVCHSLGLQDQFLADFPYAAVLKGRANYPTQLGGDDINCGDCDQTGRGEEAECTWCAEPATCAYNVARDNAWAAPIAVTNTAYYLAEANNVRKLGRQRGLVIADEADTLEGILMGTVEFRVSEWLQRRLGITAPKKGSHGPTIAKWLTGELEPAIRTRLAQIGSTKDVKLQREAKQYERMVQRTKSVAESIAGEGWVRDYDRTEALILKPISVRDVGDRWLWKHAPRWLLMSATLVSTDEMIDSLGIDIAGKDGHGLRVETVTVPMTFPLENRPIHAVRAADMSAKNKETGWPQMAHAIGRIAAKHPGQKILVHCHSYALGAYLWEEVDDPHRRPKYTYADSRARDAILAEYLDQQHEHGAIIYAPSLDRGFDFRDDAARVVIVAKVPYPYLGDKQVAARLHTQSGQTWYEVQTIRTLVQMTGRGVRSADDWCESYILDDAFLKRMWKGRTKRMLPGWWRDAVREVSRKSLGIEQPAKAGQS